MRIFRQIAFGIGILFAFAQLVYAASYTVTPLGNEFRFRNNNGARLSETNFFVTHSSDDGDAHSTLTITDRAGVVVSQYTSPNLTIEDVRSFSDSGAIAGV